MKTIKSIFTRIGSIGEIAFVAAICLFVLSFVTIFFLGWFILVASGLVIGAFISKVGLRDLKWNVVSTTLLAFASLGLCLGIADLTVLRALITIAFIFALYVGAIIIARKPIKASGNSFVI
jgi:hypothetical protein